LALGSLDDLIDADRAQVAVLEDTARAVAASAAEVTTLGDLAAASDASQVRPEGQVEHWSLPAFDAGAVPELVEADSILSNKLPLARPCVLISRLNPRWERCWMAYPGANAVASTEFVPLIGTDAAPEEVWAATSAPAFWDQMRAQVTGTTGSHQRVDKATVLTLSVPDVRTLRDADRQAITAAVQSAHALRDEIADLTRTRDDLLPLLMSGRLRVREGSPGPARETTSLW